MRRKAEKPDAVRQRRREARDVYRVGQGVDIKLLRPRDGRPGRGKTQQGNISMRWTDGGEGAPMAKARVTDVRSVGGASRPCSPEGRDGTVREGRQRIVIRGRRAGWRREPRAGTARGEGVYKCGSWQEPHGCMTRLMS